MPQLIDQLLDNSAIIVSIGERKNVARKNIAFNWMTTRIVTLIAEPLQVAFRPRKPTYPKFRSVDCPT